MISKKHANAQKSLVIPALEVQLKNTLRKTNYYKYHICFFKYTVS